MKSKDLVQEIRKDHQSPSSALRKKAKIALLHALKEDSLINTSLKLLKAQPSMATLFNLVDEVMFYFENGDTHSLEQVLREHKSEMPDETIASAPFKNISSILIHSYSQIVFDFALSLSKQRNIHFFVKESRPLCEGRDFAKKLIKNRKDVTYIIDDFSASIFPMIDMVILGADAVSKTHFTNKIGSYSLCLLAKEFKLPCVLCIDSTKFIPVQGPFLSKVDHGKKEVWSFPKLKVMNEYFEACPLKYIHGMVVDNCYYKNSDISQVRNKSFLSQFMKSLELFNH